MNDYLEYLNESPTIFFKCKNEHGWPVEFVTQNVYDILGYKAETFISSKMSFFDLVIEQDREKLMDELTKIPYIEEKYELRPYRMQTASGDILWVQDITKIIRDENGDIVYYFCYITDITKEMTTNEKLRVSENIISTIYNNSFKFIGLLSPDGTLLRANKTSLEFVNVKEEEVIGKKFWDCPWWEHSKEDQEVLKQDIQLAAKGQFIRTKKTHYDAEGNVIYVDFSLKPVFNNNNEVIYLIPEGQDITEQVFKEKQLQRYFEIIDENVLVSTTDKEGKIISFSKKFQELSEFPTDELIGFRHNIMKHADNEEHIYKELWETITKGQKWVGEHKNISKKGNIFYVENVITPNLNEKDEIEGYTSIYTNITLRKEISELLITDGLTNIYNRRHFNTIFEQELHRSKRHKYNFVLMMIDIDFFKQYNDIYGHKAGDDALITVANEIKNTLHRAEDFVFRLGGEEFAVITTDINHNGILYLAEQIRQNIESLNIKHAGHKNSNVITISIGVTNIHNSQNLKYEEIYKQADKALYTAKEEGRNRVELNE